MTIVVKIVIPLPKSFATTAESLAWPLGTKESVYKKKTVRQNTRICKKYNRKSKHYDCGAYVGLVMSVVYDKGIGSPLITSWGKFKKWPKSIILPH